MGAEPAQRGVRSRRAARLYRFQERQRWLLIVLLWLIVIPVCLGVFQRQIGLLLTHFTWSGVRYSLAYQPFAAVGLLTTLGLTLNGLLYQSWCLLFGLPKRERARLRQQSRRQ